MTETIHRPCANCPWREENHGKETPWGFYDEDNLRRLWEEIRTADGDCQGQSCHPTDPSHPDHVEAGAKEGSEPVECAGSVILVLREFVAIRDAREGDTITPEHISAYLEAKPDGLTKEGILHWLIGRYMHGGVPFFGSGSKLPEVDIDEPGIARLSCKNPD